MRAGAGLWEYWPRVLSDWEYLTLMMLVLCSLVAGEALCSQYVGVASVGGILLLVQGVVTPSSGPGSV